MRDPRDSTATVMSGLRTPSTTAGLRRRRPRPFGLVTVLALAVVLAAACSGGDDAGAGPGQASDDEQAQDAQAYIDAAAVSLTSDATLGLDRATATCVSTALVDVIGVDALDESGVTPENFVSEDSVTVPTGLPEDSTTRLSEAIAECDVERGLAAMFAATGMTEFGIELPDDAIACLGESIDPQALDDALAAFLLPSGDSSAAGDATLEGTFASLFVDAAAACPSVLTAMFLAEAPGTLTPEAQACIAAVVEGDPDRVRRAMNGDDAAAQELGTEIGTACPGSLGS
jgi:hypothetical protein